jgi:sugar transferase (PEP-CTERM/EpsH1 system associated)
MARFALEGPLSSFPLVVDLVDVDSQKWLALSRSSSWPLRWIYRREAIHLARFERRLAERAHAIIVVNERERDALRQIAPTANIRVVPVGVDLKGLVPRGVPDQRPKVVFCGVMNYAPNVDGVTWFARKVWPLIRARRRDAQFVIVGSDPTSAIRGLSSVANGIDVTGTVADVRAYLWESAVAVAPLFTARGVQNKVLEAVAAGLPAVVTTQVFDGLPASIRPACRVADVAQAFADATLSLLSVTPEDRRRVAASANLENLGWEHQLRPLSTILSDASSAPAIAV